MTATEGVPKLEDWLAVDKLKTGMFPPVGLSFVGSCPGCFTPFGKRLSSWVKNERQQGKLCAVSQSTESGRGMTMLVDARVRPPVSGVTATADRVQLTRRLKPAGPVCVRAAKRFLFSSFNYSTGRYFSVTERGVSVFLRVASVWSPTAV
jgi:hypothetical protein